MRHLKAALLCGSAAVILATTAHAQDRAEVIHWWTSGGESAALSEIVAKFEAAGGEWVDTAIAGGQNARTQGINRIVGGNPPTAMQFNTGRQFEEVIANGLLNPIDEVATEGAWADKIPEVFADAITFDGEVYAVPVNIHGQNWLFTNAEVFEKAGVEPPKTWDDVIEIGPKIEEAGFIALAQGGEAWQERTLFNAVLLGEGGADLYNAVWRDHDEETIRSDAFREVAETYGELRQFRDPGSAGRTWNLTAGLVVSGQAAMQLMGDWAKGEFIAAGQAAGDDFGCLLVGEDQSLIMGGDVFVFPKTDDEAQKATQEKLAEVMFAPDTQVAFSAKKGSMPVRTDADVSSLDECAQTGMEKIKAGETVAQVNLLASSDLVGAVDDVITQFWNDDGMDAETFVEDLVVAIQSAQ